MESKLISSNDYLPFDRYLDVRGVKLLALPEVTPSFPVNVGFIYELIFNNDNYTDATLVNPVLTAIKSNSIGQRIGLIGPEYYESIGQSRKWEQYKGDTELVDFIWQIEAGKNEQIAEILEHLLHTITGLAFKHAYPSKWNYSDSNSDINLAMNEAVIKGIYNTEGLYDGLEAQDLQQVLPQEFAFWLIVTAWDLIEVYFPDKESEWKLKNSFELREQLPLGFNLYKETVGPVLTKPDPLVLDSLLFASIDSKNEVTELTVSTGESETNFDTLSLVLLPTDENFIGSEVKKKLSVMGDKDDFIVAKATNSQAWTISSSLIGTDTLIGFSRIVFSDGILALDVGVGETAGQAYRLYQAAFARTPDMPGVVYHMNDMESNGLSIQQIATNFMASPEFSAKYGLNPTDDDYINALYQNVLGRSAGVEEVAYYQERFDSGVWDRPQVMINFAESPENVSLVGSQIENGIWMPV